MALPTGTITFLFSDIEGSTMRWEAYREAMQKALAHHDALVREGIEKYRGSVFKTVGDEFCTAFGNVSDAIAAAIDVQRTLLSQDWSDVDGLNVRIAINSGEADARDGDYFGPALNRVARLLAAAHGGQIVLTNAAAALAESALPKDVRLRDLGTHRLKDLPNPENVYQVLAPGLRADFPSLRSLESNPTNLPLHLTSLLGRAREMTEIEAALHEARLVTLIGSGGVGKTRTALQVGTTALGSFADGTWLVELAPIADSKLVPGTIGAVLRVNVGSGSLPPLEELALGVKGKQILVLLDNCEHVVAGAAEAAEYLLQRCPNVRFLATSREALGVRGEQTYYMPSLDEKTGVALFTERAQAVKHDFILDRSTAPVVGEIVVRLDGIALAIELAASRVKFLSVDRIREGLDERFKLLTGGSRTALPRQQTLRALIGWSYDLLDNAEKSMLRHLAVFRGSWTLEATVAVCVDDNFPDWDAISLLESLVEKSLVVAQPDEQRFRMLESTRAFATERLQEAGDYDAAARRHCEYYLHESDRGFDRYWRENLFEWRSSMNADLDNYRAAIKWALEDGNDVELGISLEANTSSLSIGEARARVKLSAASVDEHAPEELRGRIALAHARLWSDHGPVLDSARRAVEMFEVTGDKVHLAEALVRVGSALWRQGHPVDAIAECEQALAIVNELNLPHLAAYVQSQLGYLLMIAGDKQRGRSLLEQSITTMREFNDGMRLTFPLGNLAEAKFWAGDAVGALETINEVFEIDDELVSSHSAMMDQLNIAAYLLALDRPAEARRHAREALESALSRHENYPATVGLGHLAQAAAESGEAERAAKIIGYADSVYARLGFPREPTERRGYDRTMEILGAALPEDRLASLLADGSKMNEDAAVHEALRE
jgi:predicted ATPase/class 3 adenylate cyclase